VLEPRDRDIPGGAALPQHTAGRRRDDSGETLEFAPLAETPRRLLCHFGCTSAKATHRHSTTHSRPASSAARLVIPERRRSSDDRAPLVR
jgi:hypothetical protein